MTKCLVLRNVEGFQISSEDLEDWNQELIKDEFLRKKEQGARNLGDKWQDINHRQSKLGILTFWTKDVQ